MGGRMSALPLPLPLLLLLLLLSAAAAGSSSSTERVDLYQGDPHLVHLDNNTFYEALLQQPHAWAMEFYMDWCGHCQRFAPVWSEVARRTKDWGAVVRVGAINCARRRNNAICRQYKIHGVPQVRLFGPLTTTGRRGVSAIEHDPDKMVGAIVDFVTAVQSRERPDGWPRLSEYTGYAQQLLYSPEPLQALVLEDVGSRLGQLLQLELSSHQHLVRVSRTSRPPADLVDLPSSRPALILLREDGQQQTVTPAATDVALDLFSSVLRRLIGTAQQPALTSTAPPTAAPVPTPAPTRAPANMVFMVDMENAISVALRQEITSHALIEGEKLAALRGFLQVLLDLFPGRRHVMEALHQLQDVISTRESLTGAFLERVVSWSSPWWPGLPVLQPYQACRGSRPNYRGYSCGLWTLFHTLTVQQARLTPTGQNATVLRAVHGYVRNFFSCKHCSQHFQQMAAEDGLFSVTDVHDSVLWLWRAHNKVNKRIAGDLTDDPLHPKRQFPDDQLCPGCSDQQQFDEYAVLEFLNRFYGEENFRFQGLDPAPEENRPVAGESTSDDEVSSAAGESTSLSEGRAPVPMHQPAPTRHAASSLPDSARQHQPSAPSDWPFPSGRVSGAAAGPVAVVRAGPPPPAVLPPPPGTLQVVPGIMRYPSEMAHVFPAVLRAAPTEDQAPPSGLTETGPSLVRAQRRVVYSRPTKVYTRPGVVYTRRAVRYSQPRMTYVRPRVVRTQRQTTYPVRRQWWLPRTQ